MDESHILLFFSKFIEVRKDLELLDTFKKLKTDQERVIFALNFLLERNMVPGKTGMPKNAKESEKLREMGNIVFVNGAFNNITCIDALKWYAKAIAFAPYPSEQLALAYANRSAILFRLGLHMECIKDIDRALALNYPNNLRTKLYVRKTECLMISGNHSVGNILRKAQYWLDKMSPNDSSKKKLRTKIQVLHFKIVQTESSTQNTRIQLKTGKHLSENEVPLPTIASCNNEAPCASDAVAIKYNKRYGRHVVATRNIRPGEVIAIEKPYSLLLKPDNMQTHCSNCLRVSWANIPCNYCTYAMYCSEECRYNEWKKCHDVECAVFPYLMEIDSSDTLLFGVRLAVLALREAGGIQKLKTILKEVDEYDDLRTKGFSRDGKLHSDRYSGMYSLITNTEKRTVTDLFKRSVDTCSILYFLATRTAMFGAKLPGNLIALAKNDDVTFFGGFILRNFHMISCNVHSFDEALGLELDGYGLAAMPFCSLINHSCNPNVYKQSKPEHMVLYAMYPIEKGEQILDNYGYYYTHMPRAVRRQMLFEEYYFTCDCIPCKENWPIYEKLQSFKTLVKKPKGKAKIKEMLRKFYLYFGLLMDDEMQDKSNMIEHLLKMIQMLHKNVPMPCKDMCKVIEMLRCMYYLSGNKFEIPQIWTCQQ